MIYTVGSMLEFVGRKLDGSGIDPSCEPGTSRCIAGLNRATRMMMVENQTAVNAYTHIPVGPGGIITLDRRIKEIRAAKIPGHDQMNVFGQSARFLDGTDFMLVEGADCGPESLMFMDNQYPVHCNPEFPQQLFAVSDRQEDAGAAVTVVGLDEQGKELRISGRKGIALPITFATCDTSPVLSCPDAYSSGKVASIQVVVKPVTKGYVDIWAFDQPTGEVHWVTRIAPDETCPNLTRYQLKGHSGVKSLYCCVLLKFCMMYDVNDMSLIQQPDAIEMMTQAITLLDKSDYGGYQNFRNAAIAWINKDQKTSYGRDHRINVQVSRTPLQGDSFAGRSIFARRR